MKKVQTLTCRAQCQAIRIRRRRRPGQGGVHSPDRRDEPAPRRRRGPLNNWQNKSRRLRGAAAARPAARCRPASDGNAVRHSCDRCDSRQPRPPGWAVAAFGGKAATSITSNMNIRIRSPAARMSCLRRPVQLVAAMIAPIFVPARRVAAADHRARQVARAR